MKNLQTIVVAVDGSEQTRIALQAARWMAKSAVACRIFVVHAVRAPDANLSAVLTPYLCLGDDDGGFAAEATARARDHLTSAVGEVTGVEVVYGEPVAAISEACERMGPDLLVVAGGRLSSRNGTRLGPVAAGLLRRSACPVLVARENRPSDTPVFVTGVDLRIDSISHLAFAASAAHSSGGTVSPLFVQRRDERNRDGLSNRARKELTKRFDQLLENVTLDFAAEEARSVLIARPNFVTGDPGTVLAAAEACIVVVGRSKAGHGSSRRIGRVAEYVARYSEANVLVTPAPALRTAND